MKILDIYVLKQFIKNFIFSMFCFVIIFILVDLFSNLDKFIDKNLSTYLIVLYYLYFIPEILKLITPVSMLLSTLFTISRFNNYSEMTAINSAGISLYRFALPILTFGIFTTLTSLYFNGWVVPKSNSQKFNIERKYLDKNKITGFLQNLHIQDSENIILSMGSYNENNKTGLNASIQIFNKNDISELSDRFDIKIMKWDSIKNEWKLINVSERKFDTSNAQNYFFTDSLYPSQIAQLKKINLTPEQIIKKQYKPDELMLEDLEEYINSMNQSGQSVDKEKVDYYSKISFPFANLIVILFGISISSGKRKSGAALQFGISILITFLYLGFIKVSQTFGYNGDINPVLTAWIANISFLLLAIFNLIRINIFWK